MPPPLGVTKTQYIKDLLDAGMESPSEITKEVGCSIALAVKVKQEYTGRKIKRHGSLSQDIISMCEKDRYIKNDEVAKALGTDKSYVSQVRSKMGLRMYKTYHFSLSHENFDWLVSEAEGSGVTTSELLNAILNDERLGA